MRLLNAFKKYVKKSKQYITNGRIPMKLMIDPYKLKCTKGSQNYLIQRNTQTIYPGLRGHIENMKLN